MSVTIKWLATRLYLFNRLSMPTTKKTPKLHITGPLRGLYRWPMDSRHKGPVMRIMTSLCHSPSCVQHPSRRRMLKWCPIIFITDSSCTRSFNSRSVASSAKTCKAWDNPGNSLIHVVKHIDGLVQDCSNSSALAMELLQCCTKPSISSLLTPNERHFINILSIRALL